ncbi:lantibiotic dehydratase C-terminal domain-containing protein [Lysinibacillus sp. NPDC093688]|uniref:lantibiotic dehydratase C-terminal domain-containing protein n=1 Tax=Lysinibacillus sp. NPDC093688 TaxID=3390577 RepID=UPI003CFEE945
MYYCIYPGSLEKLDVGVEEIIIPAKDLAINCFGVEKWFFIRYMDAGGAHLRLRFHVKDIYLVEFCERMDEVLLKCLEQVERKQSYPLKRIVPNKQNIQRTVPRIEKDLYEPELKKYFNKRYLKLSEELFNYSSEIVCSICYQVNLENINRYEFGLMLMKRVFDAIELEQGPLLAFLQNYLNYWSGSDKMTYQLINIATQKRDALEAILAQDLYVDYHEEIDQYVIKLKCILFEIYDEFGEGAFYHLLFHYTHMMNNRLGIWPIEEAYLSALYIQRLQNVIAQ